MDDLKERLISARANETNVDRKRLLREAIDRIEELERCNHSRSQRLTQMKVIVSSALTL